MTDQAARKTEQGSAVGVLAGSALVIIGTLMTWITVAGGAFVYDRSGVNCDGDAKIMIALAVIAALTAVGVLTDLDVLPGFVRRGAWVDGLVIVVLGIYAVHQLQQKVADAKAVGFGVDARVGAGVWVAIAGAVLIFVSGLRMRQASKAEPDPVFDEKVRAYFEDDDATVS